ncbi:vesicular glutamate transporter 1 [Plakobranchus ocellatus]|uniref:Sialin n=1 Tax=Plakobranchus ocellatus TaxID=259542 RepID=A0AAV4BZT5_9GAST|nr:vesicular glutamate transporter 1 [Plakobranchus ocellatus]
MFQAREYSNTSTIKLGVTGMRDGIDRQRHGEDCEERVGKELDLIPQSSGAMVKAVYTTRGTDRVQIDPKDVPFWFSSRLGLAIIAFLGFINVYALRVNLSVAIVCMVNHTAIRSDNDASNATSSECSSDSTDNSTSDTTDNILGGELLWEKPIQGTILGSFFWGYLLGQIPAGWAATKFGGKWIMASTMFVSALGTLLTPVLAQAHYWAVIVLRIVLGIATGMTFPAMHTMWGKWAPPLERTKLITFTYAGAQVGIVMTFPLSGFLCKYGFAGGWPSIFYVTGGICLVWSILWMVLVSEDPKSHPRISDIERDYILGSLESKDTGETRKVHVPWLSIILSLPVWAIVVANVTSDWGAYTLLTNIPTYINEVLKFDITSNGLVSALPYIAFWIVINIGGWAADFVRNKHVLSTGMTRKVFNTFGKVVPAVMLIALGYVDCSKPALAIVLLILAVSLTGSQYSGYLVNHVDIAPKFAGILFGISNSLAAVTGFISPVVVGVITQKGQTRAEWQIVFYVAAAIYIFGAIFFAIFASGELQSWAQVDPTSGKDVELTVSAATGEDDDMLVAKQNGTQIPKA